MILWSPTPVHATDKAQPTGKTKTGRQTVLRIKLLCPIKSHCQGQGAFVANDFAGRADLEGLELYDTRPSIVLPGYYHLSIRAENGPFLIVVTNGNYMVPTILPVSPVKIGALSSGELKLPAPTNLFYREENGMYVAHPALSKTILMGKGKKGYVLIADALWERDFADLVELMNELYRDRKDEVPSLYFVPSFGFMSSRTAYLGRYYFALTEDFGIKPIEVAYNLSKAGHEIKGFREPLFALAVELVLKHDPDAREEEVKKKLRASLRKWTGEKVFSTCARIMKESRVGLIEHVVIIDDRIFYHPSLLGNLDTPFREYLKKLLP